MKIIYRVSENENIKDICSKYNVDVNFIKKINNIEEVQNGQRILIDCLSGEKYIVKPFDTIEKIALKFNITPEIIKEHNKIDNVFIGQVIFIDKSYKPKEYFIG